jgi:hypothetical protein
MATVVESGVGENMNLGRLEKVELRDVWKTEAQHFTPWLAGEENLALLGDTIGLDLELEAVEKDVGPFRADILCKDTANDSWVLIENQVERTDHTHLGQLLTYAAGLNTVTIVWIAKRFTDEHRAALDWLNEITGDEVSFFGLEVELWRIGDSAVAPKFNVVSKPNEWTKGKVGGSKVSAGSGHLTEAKKRQLDFWHGFREYALENATRIKPTKASPQHWMNMSLGKSGVNLCAVASHWNSETESFSGHELRADLVLRDENANGYFAALESSRTEIEQEIGEAMTWHNPESKKMCRIWIRKDTDLENESLREEQYGWLLEKLEKMHAVFGSRVRKLDIGKLL